MHIVISIIFIYADCNEHHHNAGNKRKPTKDAYHFSQGNRTICSNIVAQVRIEPAIESEGRNIS